MIEASIVLDLCSDNLEFLQKGKASMGVWKGTDCSPFSWIALETILLHVATLTSLETHPTCSPTLGLPFCALFLIHPVSWPFWVGKKTESRIPHSPL